MHADAGQLQFIIGQGKSERQGQRAHFWWSWAAHGGGRPVAWCARGPRRKTAAAAGRPPLSPPAHCPRSCNQSHPTQWGSLRIQILLFSKIIITIVITVHTVPAKRQGTSCRQAAVTGCHNPSPCWTRQIQARPNQPWTRCSVLIPPPTSRGQQEIRDA